MKIFYLDIAAVLIDFVLLLGALVQNGFRNRKQQQYLLVVLISMITGIFDILAIALENLQSTQMEVRYLANGGYLIFHAATTIAYFLYLMGQADVLYRIYNKKRIIGLFLTPILILTLLIVTTPWTGWMFYFGENGKYIRGPVFIVMYVVAGFYMACILVALIRFAKVYPRKRFISFLVLFPMTLAGMAVQYFNPKLIIELFSSAVCFIFISLMTERPEDRMDMDTRLSNSGAYNMDMRRNYLNHKPGKVILMSIMNYRSLQEMLPYAKLRELILHVAGDVKGMAATSLVELEFYHLGEGNFAVTSEPKYLDKMDVMAENIRFAMNEEVLLDGEEIRLESNVCMIRIPEDIGDFDNLVRFTRRFGRQDYKSIQNLGLDSETTDENYSLLLNMDDIVKRAVEENEIRVAFQPIFKRNSSMLEGAEALIRYEDPVYGTIDSQTMIDNAERNGLIHELGNLVLNRVAEFLISEEFEQKQLEYVTVNLSPLQCIHKNMAMNVLDLIDKYGLRADRLRFEIRETGTYMEQAAFRDNVRILQAVGIEFALDGYGANSIGAGSILNLKVSMVKLDRNVMKACRDPETKTMMMHMVRMLQDMGKEVIAVGVEDEELNQIACSMGCDAVQGYYFGKEM